MNRMTLEPNLAAFESYANAQIQIVESKVQDCVAGAGGSPCHPSIEFIREITPEVNLIIHGFNKSNLSSQDVANLLPRLKGIGANMDRCASELKTANWYFKFRYATAISNFSHAADRVDSLIETLSMSLDPRFFELIREATKETVA